MDGMSQFGPAPTRAAPRHAQWRDVVRGALLLSVVAALLTVAIADGARRLANPPATDALQYAPIGW